MIQSSFSLPQVPLSQPGDPRPPLVTAPHQMTVVTVDMDTERTRARHRDKWDKTQDVFAEESEALDQIAKQVINNVLSEKH